MSRLPQIALGFALLTSPACGGGEEDLTANPTELGETDTPNPEPTPAETPTPTATPEFDYSLNDFSDATRKALEDITGLSSNSAETAYERIVKVTTESLLADSPEVEGESKKALVKGEEESELAAKVMEGAYRHADLINSYYRGYLDCEDFCEPLSDQGATYRNNTGTLVVKCEILDGWFVPGEESEDDVVEGYLDLDTFTPKEIAPGISCSFRVPMDDLLKDEEGDPMTLHFQLLSNAADFSHCDYNGIEASLSGSISSAQGEVVGSANTWTWGATECGSYWDDDLAN